MFYLKGYKMMILKIDFGVICKLIIWFIENYLIDKCCSYCYVIVLKFKVFKILLFNVVEIFKIFILIDK